MISRKIWGCLVVDRGPLFTPVPDRDGAQLTEWALAHSEDQYMMPLLTGDRPKASPFASRSVRTGMASRAAASKWLPCNVEKPWSRKMLYQVYGSTGVGSAPYRRTRQVADIHIGRGCDCLLLEFSLTHSTSSDTRTAKFAVIFCSREMQI